LDRSQLEARLHFSAGDPEAALIALKACEPVTLREQVDLWMLRARCDDEPASPIADVSLAAAVDTARAQGFTFALAEELFPLSRRLGTLLHSAPLDDLADTVLELLQRVVPLPVRMQQSHLVEPLTERELVVLRYLSSRLTTSEIAQQLYVSVNTVRTHAKAVYGKLGVSSRHDAVAEAHRLGIR
jgi:DNA-binding CsgD family transcriptional regulator